jgi:hypothetical protein
MTELEFLPQPNINARLGNPHIHATWFALSVIKLC